MFGKQPLGSLLLGGPASASLPLQRLGGAQVVVADEPQRPPAN